MKLEVFDYLIAVERYGSLNSAAEHLYVSQPNLTAVIRKLEAELGYAILARSHRGVSFTEEGRHVLRIAHGIVESRDALYQVPQAHASISLRLSLGNSLYAITPLCEMLQKVYVDADIQVTLSNCAVLEAMEKLYRHQLDLAYMIVPDHISQQLDEYARTHQLNLTCMRQFPCAIQLRRNHPLLKSGFHKALLWNYPFVDFLNQSENIYGPYQLFINPKKLIAVDHFSIRQEIIARTDAFGIGIATAGLASREAQMQQLPLPDLTMSFYEARRVQDRRAPLYRRMHQEVERIVSAG